MDKEKQDRIKEKARMKIAVVNFNEEQITKSKNGILKMVATFVLAIGITTGLVYGGSVVYDKIWKEPESYKISKDISEEEKAKCISEEEAEKIGNSYLKKIGLSDETIQSLGLTKEFLSDENVWHMGSQKATLTIDAEKGIIKSVQIPTWEYKIPYNYGITREDARKVAKELLEKYRPEDDKGDYKLVKLTRNMETDEASYIWYAIFQKKYGDLYNANEEINIGWVPTINGLYNLSFKRNVYENNEDKISKEEAMKIATEKDKQIEVTDEQIVEIIAKEAKKRKDSIADYEKSRRQDLLDQIHEEISILEEYLPEQLSIEEVEAKVKEIITELGASSMKEMGMVMKTAKERLGASADGKTINDAAKKLLS